MKKERLCKRCSIRFQHTGNSSLRAHSGLQAFCSPSPISAGRKFSAFCSSWLPSPPDDDGPIEVLVGHVRLRPAGVFAVCKNRLRGQSPSSSQLGDVRGFHRSFSALRRTFLDRVGTGIAIESGMGRSVVPHTRGHINPSAASIATLLVSNSSIRRASQGGA
jgi:hypothetical protein